jgi:hypothetical protein
MPFGSIGWGECLFLLFVLVIVAALAFRSGYFRGRGGR